MNISARTALGKASVKRPTHGFNAETDLAISILATLAQTKSNQNQNVISLTLDLDGVDPAYLISLSEKIAALKG